ncbi:MAG: methylated-DNA--[protein]-cysteine S-methyltransferase [Kiritimatiellae bacterium]|nr:methylated-DNA--[protein]-cysteine S-methyltransferase [Kiritimatiellia bacterium]
MKRHPPCTGSLDVDTTWGTIRIRAVDGRVVACTLPRLRSAPVPRFRCQRFRITARDASTARVLRSAAVFVRQALAGRSARPPPLRLPQSAPFTQRVWRALARIPRGTTMTYGELAARAGNRRGARAAGRACGANALPLFIPCHRVIAGDGSLGGFSSGVPWKKLLLERERHR